MPDPTPDAARRLLDDAAVYLAATHRHANRHDLLGANLACAGCELLGRIEAAQTAEHEPQQPSETPALCGKRSRPQRYGGILGPCTKPPGHEAKEWHLDASGAAWNPEPDTTAEGATR